MSHWTERAACFGYPVSRDDDPWYGKNPLEQRDALAMCRVCPVTVQCLAEGLRSDAEHGRHGIWGGLTAEQRGELTKVAG